MKILVSEFAAVANAYKGEITGLMEYFTPAAATVHRAGNWQKYQNRDPRNTAEFIALLKDLHNAGATTINLRVDYNGHISYPDFKITELLPELKNVPPTAPGGHVATHPDATEQLKAFAGLVREFLTELKYTDTDFTGFDKLIKLQIAVNLKTAEILAPGKQPEKPAFAKPFKSQYDTFTENETNPE